MSLGEIPAQPMVIIVLVYLKAALNYKRLGTNKDAFKSPRIQGEANEGEVSFSPKSYSEYFLW